MPPPPIPTKSKPEAGSPPPIPKKKDALQRHRSKSGTVSLDSVFAEIDRDSSGYITFSEFVRWWKGKDTEKHTHSMTDEVLQEGMKQFHEQDIDGNGSIDRDELAGLVLALHMEQTVLKGQIDVTDLGLEAEEGDAAEEEDGEAGAEPEPEPAAAEPRHRRLKMFYAKQHFIDEAPETVQLAVGNMSLMVMYHGETISTYPYVILKNWGKTADTFWLNSIDFATDEVVKYEFDTAEGKKISDLMVTQAQEMAKLMKPGSQNKGSVGWEDLMYEIKVYTAETRGVYVGSRVVHLELEGEKGRSGTLKMPNASDTGRACFQRGQVDSFLVKLKPAASNVRAGHVPDFSCSTDNYAYLPAGVNEIGNLEKLTVGHDGTGRGAGWHVNKVVVINVRTHEKIEFMVDHVLDKTPGPDPMVQVSIPDDCGEVVVAADEDMLLEPMAIEKESVVGTYRALRDGVMREDFEAQGEKIGKLTEGDIVECFEEKDNAKGQKRLRVLSPAGIMGWVSFVAQDGTTIFKTTTSWGSYRENPDGDGCSGWLEKKGGMRTNWQKRWFHLKDLTLSYYETNKVGVGKAEKGKVSATPAYACR
jgi:hypothetical protein